MDVVAFWAVLTAYIWLVIPVTRGDSPWDWVVVLGALAIPVVSLVRDRPSPRELGLRVDNLGPALAGYVGAGVASAFLIVGVAGALGVGLAPPRPLHAEASRIVVLLGWVTLQQALLLLFFLRRLRTLLGSDRLAVAATAVLFAFFHLPNPFLTAYTLVGGLVVGALFVWRPSLPAAVLSHALASTIVASLLAPGVTGAMKVGPNYWW